jgi:hypothetical protein
VDIRPVAGPDPGVEKPLQESTMSTSTLIAITYTSIDRYRVTRRYRTLDGARAFAQEYVGRFPSIGSSYAVSDDGIGKITVCGASLADLFPAEQHVEQCIRDLDGDREQNVGSADWFDEAGERAWQQRRSPRARLRLHRAAARPRGLRLPLRRHRVLTPPVPPRCVGAVPGTPVPQPTWSTPP